LIGAGAQKWPLFVEKMEVATHGRAASDAVSSAIVLHDEPAPSPADRPTLSPKFLTIQTTAGTPFYSRRSTSCRRTFCFLHPVRVV
jgi:hypothetical protein